MNIVTFATIIVAAALAWLVLFGCERSAVPTSVSVALAIFAALLVYTLGPAIMGG